MVVRKVTFNERVTVASLPIEEFKEAYHARRGLWGSAPVSDELWDGDRRVFWERELTSDELREILRFRRLARYATMLQNVGMFGLKVPMPRVPQVIEELVKEARLQSSSPNSSPKLDASTLEDGYHLDPIALPNEEHDTSPRYHEKRKSGNLSVTSVEDIYSKKAAGTEQFEFSNPNLSPQNTTASTAAAAQSATAEPSPDDSKKRLSTSQKAAMQNVGKVLRLDSPRLGHVIHKTRSKRSRARKRVASHSILQPCVYQAWKDQKAVRAAIEVPWFFERLLKVPDIPLLQSTVFIGLFAVEVTSILYVLVLLISQLMIFLIVRPLILSLSTSFAEKGAAMD